MGFRLRTKKRKLIQVLKTHLKSLEDNASKKILETLFTHLKDEFLPGDTILVIAIAKERVN